jgi:predicted O-linked N-acetylglucosamine transferase (SPINDLY family)
LSELIADNSTEYIHIAKSLASKSEWYYACCQKILTNLPGSRLLDSNQYSLEFSRLFDDILNSN